MEVIEGKQVVLRPSITEAQCVRPKKGQAAVYTVPVEYAERAVSPADYMPQTVLPAKMRVPYDCVPKAVQAVDPISQKHCIQDTEPLTVPQEIKTERITAKPLQVNRVHTVSATPELGKMLDETASARSGAARKKWFAEAILGMAHK